MAKPTDSAAVYLDQLISSIQTHLPTIKGIYFTTSLYPPLLTPGPGAVPFAGYTIPPASPTPPTPPVTVADSQTSTPAEENGYALSDEDIEVKKKEIAQATATLNHPKATPEQKESAKEYIEKTQHEIDTRQASSVESSEPINSTPVVINGNVDNTCPIGLKVVEFAKKDVGIIETGTKANNGAGKNYGGNVGGGETPPGKPGRIDIMVTLAGLDNQGQVRATGEGYYWCASAVTAWWKSAGLKTPPGAASCKNWALWGKKNGTYSKSPKIGAAALYGGEGKEHHIGIVAAISKDGKITTIEGNTGGGGFNRNGCGCFVKTPRVSNISGFVIPPSCMDKK
jgi:hypothetical protein